MKPDQLILKTFWTILLIAYPLISLASDKNTSQQCSTQTLNIVGNYYALKAFRFPKDNSYTSIENGGVLTEASCKKWPAIPQILIASFIYETGLEDGQQQWLTVLIDLNTLQIIADHTEPIGDAVLSPNYAKLWIDTARYKLSDDTRAFGLVINGFTDRCTYDGGLGNDLHLFIIKDSKLIKVLENLSFYTWIYLGKDRCNDPAPLIQETFVSLAIGKTNTNGFADLIVTGKTAHRTTRARIKFNGTQYDLTPWYNKR